MLFAALDWGLGHATRSIPLIRAFLKAGSEVVLAADGAVARVWKEEFSSLEILSLPGYNVTYARQNLMWHLVQQLPKLRSAIVDEQQWLGELMSKRHIDIVVSDNRYGLSNPDAHCVFVTHQLKPALPKLLRWAEPFLQAQLYRYLNRFNTIWVPDAKTGVNAISGKLGHPHRMPKVPVHYVGWLTRFAKQELPQENSVLIVLSGPEPQRTLLEESIIKQLPIHGENIVLVRGLPGHDITVAVEGVRIFNHLNSAQFNNLLHKAEFVISRGGYSTLMDSLTLGKRCIVIPTPGQTEQEYLAQTLGEKSVVLAASQQHLDLKDLLQQARHRQWLIPNSLPGEIEPMVKAVLQNWQQRKS